MAQISDLASFVDAKPIQLLTRAQLWKIAERHGLKHPRDATKDEMVRLFEANRIDVTRPENGVQWMRIEGRDERGQPSSYIAPAVPAGKSGRNHVNADAMLQARLEQSETQEKAQAIALADEQKKNRALMQRLEALEAKLAAAPVRAQKKRRTSERWRLYRECKAAGRIVTATMSVKELKAALDGEDSP